MGRLVTDQGAPLGTVENGKLPCNNPPKSSPALQKLQALKKKLAALDPDQLDQIVDFDTTNEVLDGWIKHIDVEDTGGFWNEAADSGMQGLKAVTGFAKAAVFGMGEMAYEGLKLANPAGQIHAQLDARILAEQIRLGNICAESVKRAAKGAWEGFKEPIVEAWDRGDYVEVVTRGVLEVGSLFIGIGEIKALAAGGKVAAKGAEAIDDMADAAAASHRAARNADDAPESKPEPESDKPNGNDNGVKIEEASHHQKAAFGEKVAHDTMLEKGYEPMGKTDGKYEPGKQGIDGVYKNPHPPPDYIFTDAKFGKAQLENTKFGRQLSDEWIRARLNEILPNEQEAFRVARALKNGQVGRWVIKVKPNGSTVARLVDEQGYVILGNKGLVPGW